MQKKSNGVGLDRFKIDFSKMILQMPNSESRDKDYFELFNKKYALDVCHFIDLNNS